jgi:hypothetical protein
LGGFLFSALQHTTAGRPTGANVYQLYPLAVLYGVVAQTFLFSPEILLFFLLSRKFSTFFSSPDQTGICFADKTSKMGDSIAEIGVYAALKGGNFT